MSDLARDGWVVLPEVVPVDELDEWRARIDAVLAQQVATFGAARLAAIGDQAIARAPLLHDSRFLALASHPLVLRLVREVLGEWAVLGLQNAIVIAPGARHCQQQWHRDLPHQNWTSSRPLALAALMAIDPFTAESGATEVIPGSHKREGWGASDIAAAKPVIAPAGAVIVFDAMLVHRAGHNAGNVPRRAINHNYLLPILRPQYDFPAALGPGADLAPDLRRLLGYDNRIARDDDEWRTARLARFGGAG